MTSEIEQVKLSEFFSSVKKPRFVLGTTYTLSLAFFESVVFPVIPRRDLKHCVIISDSHGYHRSLDEGGALQGAAQSYMVVPAPISGCFHAKVWLLLGESEASLLVGSGNLTQSGFMTNAELFDSLHFTSDNPPTPEQFNSITSFISGLAGMWPEQDRGNVLCVEMLVEMRRHLSALFLKNQIHVDKSPRFMHSFNGALIEQLPETDKTQSLQIAAPFFGNSTAGLMLLQNRYSPERTNLFPAVHNERATDFPADAVAAEPGITLSRLHVKGKDSSFAHLKLYGGLNLHDEAWLCCTSANCTSAAWQGSNIEAGLVRFIKPDTLSTYFNADKKPLPDGSISYDGDKEKSSRLNIWATESGVSIEIMLASTSAGKAPLRDAALIVRCGSNTASILRENLFVNSSTEHINLSAFNGFNLTRNMSVCLEIHATSNSGNNVCGACFVENRMLLIADPIHRSAWRGALALLDTESMPDLADIAAIFTLVSNIFDGRLVSRVSLIKNPKSEEEKEDEDDGVIHVPIWPPISDTRELQSRIGATGIGQLALCQKILSKLLNPQTPDTTKHETQTLLEEIDGDDLSEDPVSKAVQEEREDKELRAKKQAQQLWNRADKDYQSLRSRLQTLCPEVEVAPNVWPASVFVFLATAAVHRLTSRIATNLDKKITMRNLIDQFIHLMLYDRKQAKDFCCPKSFRYRSDVSFPPLSSDLRNTFNAEPGCDLAAVMVAVLVAHKMNIAPENQYPAMWPLCLQKIVGKEFEPDKYFGGACLRIWSQYLHEYDSVTSDTDFNAAYEAIWSAYRGKTA